MSRPALHTVVEPVKARPSLGLRELWEYRELLYFLALRDISVRYKQAVLGIAWAVIQPVAAMIIFTTIFGKVAKLPSEGVPYPLLTFSALLPWQLFAGAVERSGVSLVSNSQLLTKVYFPRMVIPLSATCAGLVEFGISMLVLVGLMVWFGALPSVWVLLLPLFILMALITALAMGLWLSALHAQYRDVGHMIPFLVHALMWVSPVAYSATIVPGGIWRILYGLNPMAGVIQGFRWCLLGATPPDTQLFLASCTVVVIFFLAGLHYFRRTEILLADVI